MPRQRSELAKQLLPMRVYHVYDRRGRVVYVGVTSNGINTRMASHRSLARKHEGARGSPFLRWLFKEMDAGRNPDARFVAICGDDHLEDERREIRKQLRRGQPLLNVMM